MIPVEFCADIMPGVISIPHGFGHHREGTQLSIAEGKAGVSMNDITDEHWLDSHKLDDERHWWVQCENVIGHVNLFQHFRDEESFDKAVRCWAFIKKHLIDWDNGEWHWSLFPDGTVNLKDDKAGFWKCPYHNSRMCIELMERKF